MRCYLARTITQRDSTGSATGTGHESRSRDQKVAHYLNGVKVMEYERGTQMWKALVAYSKYADWPAFGEAESGTYPAAGSWG